MSFLANDKVLCIRSRTAIRPILMEDQIYTVSRYNHYYHLIYLREYGDQTSFDADRFRHVTPEDL